MPPVKRLLVLLLTALLSACASVPPPHIDVPDLARSQAVTVRDARPTDETERKAFSYLITSDAYGLLRNGEMGIDPPLLRLLQHRVFERDGAGAKVTVYHFVTYQNLQAMLRGIAIGSVIGPVGSVIAANTAERDVAWSATLVDRAAFEAMTGENEWKRAAVSAVEDPKKAAAFVTYLDAEVDGRRSFVRVVSPVAPGADGKNGYAAAVDATIRQWLDSSGKAGEAARSPAAVPAASASASANAGAGAGAGAPAATAVAAESHRITSRPANAKHLEAAMLDGRSWVFPHPRDPDRYGFVHLQFAAGIAHADNRRSKAAGPYTVKDDMVCIDFDSPAWGHTCYYVLDGATQPTLLTVFTGRSVPLTIR